MKTSVIVGSMFSGKTSLLNKKIREARRLDCFYVMTFKPSIDNRYDKNNITTHDQIKEPVTLLINEPQEIWDYYVGKRHEINNRKVLVFIDEIQFFDSSSLLSVIRKLNFDGVEVIASGLDMDKFGRPFGATPAVMAIADEVIKLKTKCACGADSYTQISKTNNKELVDIGADSYQAVCKKCFFDYMKQQAI